MSQSLALRCVLNISYFEWHSVCTTTTTTRFILPDSACFDMLGTSQPYLIWIRCIDTIITFVADTIAIQIRLIGIRHQRAIIACIRIAIVIDVIVARITDAIFIEIQLIIVDDFRAIIACITLPFKLHKETERTGEYYICVV